MWCAVNLSKAVRSENSARGRIRGEKRRKKKEKREENNKDIVVLTKILFITFKEIKSILFVC